MQNNWGTEHVRTLLLTGLAVRTREPRSCSSVRPCSFRMPTSSFALGRFAGLWSRQAFISWAIDAGHSSGTLRGVRGIKPEHVSLPAYKRTSGMLHLELGAADAYAMT